MSWLFFQAASSLLAAVLALAQKKNLLVGCAPDTFLGGGLQGPKEEVSQLNIKSMLLQELGLQPKQ